MCRAGRVVGSFLRFPISSCPEDATPARNRLPVAVCPTQSPMRRPPQIHRSGPQGKETECITSHQQGRRLTFLGSGSSSVGYHLLAFSVEAGTSRVDLPKVFFWVCADMLTLRGGVGSGWLEGLRLVMQRPKSRSNWFVNAAREFCVGAKCEPSGAKPCRAAVRISNFGRRKEDGAGST